MAILSELYTNKRTFVEGEYAPIYGRAYFDFEMMSPFIQAQQFEPCADRIGGSGRLGASFKVYESEGGLSPARELFGTVTSEIVEGTDKTIYMGMNAEYVKSDTIIDGILSPEEFQRQLRAALSRLNKTFIYKTFNADVDVLDPTKPGGVGKYDFDGVKKFFDTNPGQMINDALEIGSVVNSQNMTYRVNAFLGTINSLVDVNGMSGEVIYTSKRGKKIIQSMEADKFEYKGIYKFSQNIISWNGIPVIDIPDFAIPQSFKDKGEFVLFANQDLDGGFRQLVSKTGKLLDIGKQTANGNVTTLPINLIFATLAYTSKCLAVGFLKESNTP